MTPRFFSGISPISQKDRHSSTCFWSFSPNTPVGTSEKQSIVRQYCICLPGYQKMRPLLLAAARPMKAEWKMRPYFGVLPLVFKALEIWSLCWAQGITQTPGLSLQSFWHKLTDFESFFTIWNKKMSQISLVQFFAQTQNQASLQRAVICVCVCAMLHNIQDLRSPTRDWIFALLSGSRES